MVRVQHKVKATTADLDEHILRAMLTRAAP